MKLLGGKWGVILLVLTVLAAAGVLFALQLFKDPPVLQPAVDLAAPGSKMRPATVFMMAADTLALKSLDLVILDNDSQERAVKDLVRHLATEAEGYHRVLPAGTEVLHFFQTEDGQVVLDFNAAIERSESSSIAEERMRLSALIRTLTGNLGGIRSLRLLVHGRPLERWGQHLRLDPVIDLESRL